LYAVYKKKNFIQPFGILARLRTRANNSMFVIFQPGRGDTLLKI